MPPELRLPHGESFVLRHWVGILSGFGLATLLFWAAEPLDDWIGIPDVRKTIGLLVLASGFGLTFAVVERALQRAYQDRLRFFRQFSHQLRTPITAISAYVEILRDRPPQDAATRARFLGILATEAASLANLVDDLLSLAQLDAAGPQLEWRPVNLARLADAAVAALQPVAAGQGVILRALLDPETPSVNGDEELLKQLLTNLIDNAIKYNQANGRVCIGLRADQGMALLTVSDTGPGIEREHLDHIFEEFYRERRPGGKSTRGSGLGLAIVERIAKLHGGQIEVQSEPGLGSLFTVCLPLASATMRRTPAGRLTSASRWRLAGHRADRATPATKPAP